MLREKFVGYLDKIDENKGKQCVGYIRVEVFDEICNFEICVQKMHATDSFTRGIRMQGRSAEGRPLEYEMGKVQLKNGQGMEWFQGLDRNNLSGSGISWERLEKLDISIGTGNEIICEIHRKVLEPEPVNAEPDLSSDYRLGQELKAAEMTLEMMQPEINAEVLDEKGENPNTAEEQMPCETKNEEDGIKEDEKNAKGVYKWNPEEARHTRDREESIEESEQIRIPRMQEEKWGQLSTIYPKVNPFKDKRTYLKLGIQDFVILPEKYYVLCKNSFLLHGYMNYGYLVLGMFVKRGIYEYYLGVPGVFYEKERQVAKLYGFDYFEADRELARDGDFGIYLMKILL